MEAGIVNAKGFDGDTDWDKVSVVDCIAISCLDCDNFYLHNIYCMPEEIWLLDGYE